MDAIEMRLSGMTMPAARRECVALLIAADGKGLVGERFGELVRAVNGRARTLDELGDIVREVLG